MSAQTTRLVAGLSLLAGGFVVGVSVLAVAFAGILANAGMTIRPSDAALLDDLLAVLPFVGGFAILSLLAGAGVIAGSETAATVAVGTSIAAVAIGIVGLALIVVGRDPFATATSTADGIGVVGTFTFIYATVLVALATARTGSTSSNTQAVMS